MEDCKEMKSMRAEFYVLCNTFHIPTIMRYLGLKIPVFRCSEKLYTGIYGTQRQIMTGPFTFVTPDTLAIVGKSAKFHNLYYNIGSVYGDLESYKRNAAKIVNILEQDILKREIKRDPNFAHELTELEPKRFKM